MFFIKKLHKFNRREITLLHVGPAILVFAAFFTLTVWNWLQLKNNAAENRQALLVKNVSTTQDSINKTFNTYEDVLNAGTGLFNASDYVARNEWKDFVDIFDLKDRYPGINSMGFVQVVKNSDLQAYTKTVQSKENPAFSVHPNSSSDLLAPIKYDEPSNPRDNHVVGYDMYSSPKLRAGMEQARDSGQISITSQLPGVQNSPFGNTPQIIMFSPVYTKNSNSKDVDSRQKNISGYIYADILTYNFMGEFYSQGNNDFAFRIYDSDQANGAVLYQTPNFDSVNASGDKQTYSRQIGVDNHRWTILGAVRPGIIPSRDQGQPTNALLGGIIFSLFLAIFIYTLLLNRTRALGDKEEQQVQSAKDELLALASHQLRTPATGVKQYIGMLREGYGGELTREQKKYLNEAYDSNERQLGIINDMLFVARSDNGEIKFDFKHVDLLAFLKDVLKEHQPIIKANGQKLVRKLPNKPVEAFIDDHYLRMALDNLLSNATKYTQPGGVITLSLKKTRNQAVITVEDTGVGIKEKYYDMLFKKFSRVPNDLSSQTSGSGIGLYLAKKVVDAHRGKIDFKSSEGKGSVCSITLPLNRKKKKNNNAM